MSSKFNEPPAFHELKSLGGFSAVVCNAFRPKEISCLDQKIKYLFDYLTNKLGATRMMTEKFYFSQSYFDDYKFYHINSYHDFEKTCSRIHFFRTKETKNAPELFDNEQKDKETIEFWNSYLGYIVVRPLPEGIIGATLLKYPYVEDLYYIPRLTITTEERINIFGYQINNFKTLIYQEQDRIVGACATTALWSALDTAHDLFDIPHYSPSKLTELAGKSHIGKKPQRKFPNKGGLNLFQISEILDKIGLDHDTIINEGVNQSENAFKEFRRINFY